MTSDDQNEVFIFFIIKYQWKFLNINFKCPLCMEPFEVDDASFYPCTCGYQVKFS